MRYVDRVEVRTPQRGSLRPGRRSKHLRSDSYGGNSGILDANRVVQTARRARPSIGEGLDHGMRLGLADVSHHALGSGLRKGWLAEAQDL